MTRRLGCAVVVLLGALSMAPTAGDVGGCGESPTALDTLAYAAARKTGDCGRCEQCGLVTARCRRACDATATPETVVPATCHPLRHDGEVCLRARAAASCDAFASYLSDDAPQTPTECAFCARDGG